MNNNDVLRRLRYTFNFSDKKMADIFFSAGETVSREQISQWLKKEDAADAVVIADIELATFLNGFINEKRGKKPGPQAAPEKRLNNNIILTKLKIALNLKAEQVISLLNTVDFRLSKPELSAFSRKVGHQHYRECKDQVLRNLLQAIDKKYHVERTTKIERPTTSANKKANGDKFSNNKKKPKSEAKHIDGARPNASNIYINPNSTKPEQPKRNRLKLNKSKE